MWDDHRRPRCCAKIPPVIQGARRKGKGEEHIATRVESESAREREWSWAPLVEVKFPLCGLLLKQQTM